MLNVLIFAFAILCLLIGLGFIYKPVWLVKFNKFAREKIFVDNLILLERRQKGVLFVLLFFFLAYLGYYRSLYSIRYTDRLVSTDRLLYQSLLHLHARQYAQVKKLCEKVMKRDPSNAQALYYRAAAQDLLYEASSAERSWAQAKAIDPDSANARSIREWVIKVKGPDSPELSVLK